MPVSGPGSGVHVPEQRTFILKRAINGVLYTLTGAALAGGLATGLAVADDHSAPEKPVTSTAQQHAANKESGTKAGKAGKEGRRALLGGTTTSSYFWDDGSGINGDTGEPASGKPMQKGAFASPSWPMDTKVRVTYQGRSVTGFIGDRGPGDPSHEGVMLDLDTYTFRHLVDGKQPESKYNTGTDQGHLKGVKWEVLEWGDGPGKGKPKPLG
jgi:hypothetical protein